MGNCIECGRKLINYKKKYCNRECQEEFLERKRTIKNCVICGKDLSHKPSKDYKFCSLRCMWEAKKNRVHLRCKLCGKEFYRRRSYVEMGWGSFCSNDCKNKGIDRSGKNNPCWRGGISQDPYPYTFIRTFKERIRQRDKYTCCICGKFGNIVHHIDYNKKNTEEWNCITLCHSCHSKTNHNRKQWKSILTAEIRRRIQPELFGKEV